MSCTLRLCELLVNLTADINMIWGFFVELAVLKQKQEEENENKIKTCN